MYRYLRYIPKNHLSRLIGRLVHVRLPRPIARRMVSWFAKSYEIDVSAASRDIDEYASIGEFFTRDLREGLRPIEADFVSPVDGVLRSFGVIHDRRLPQIKDKSYSLERFVGGEALAKRYEDGIFFNLYLSPQDYHHVHFPVGGKVTGSIHIPGKLWPVNDWSLGNIDELFSINERVVTWIDCNLGRVAAVMIGATNVGKISVTYDSFISNTARTTEIASANYEPPIEVKAGDRLGTFHMGSSVVLLLEPGAIDLARVKLEPGQKVRYGEAVL